MVGFECEIPANSMESLEVMLVPGAVEAEAEFVSGPTPEIIGVDAICNGQTATLEVVDANQYYYFLWSPNGETTQS